MSETWDQMEARHARERAEKLQELVALAERAGPGYVPEARLPLQTIAERVAQDYATTVSALRGPGKERRASIPRQHAYFEASRSGWPMTVIGDFFGGRDHTSVAHGIKRHEARVIEAAKSRRSMRARLGLPEAPEGSGACIA
ncbi:helix-turn-helix domain-containing protein [Ponticoccus alexandrii]|uniref:Chromosomal replication initiator DnaA C-terminal domain-containing protein n=1 Tax=Ponticoccus alexandrii TaxID=1943633 RepID=A0ABX7F7W4_9RHOB|nr:helix-turn-helix domain-containing protein [Ponticoccus alexandrii]ETA53995.1 hypothetical protein P279_00260 [Rhodobacteraceae bacterium PD-2]QRF66362.1 hypothetical protein GQA70_08600 [Ponticoccus alexandrii]